jgi:MinD-like ATPase involved in chromosome partitioning or flagellar assembly
MAPSTSGVPTGRDEPASSPEPSGPGGPGTVLAVWGPAGSPGRSTITLGLADALAGRGVRVLVIDADPYGGCLATLVGLLDEAPGLAAACRAANAGILDVARLAECCRAIGTDVRVLTGLGDPRRWPEVRASALEVVLSLSRWLADVVIVDCGFSLEEDEELAYDTSAPRRNAATLTSVRAADRVLAVGSADPVGLSRVIRELPRLTAVLDGEDLASGRVLVVVNRLRGGIAARPSSPPGGTGSGAARCRPGVRRRPPWTSLRPMPRTAGVSCSQRRRRAQRCGLPLPPWLMRSSRLRVGFRSPRGAPRGGARVGDAGGKIAAR